MDLLQQLEKAEAEAERLRREVAQGPCSEYGHSWQFIGGCNAGCDHDCGCSVPVHVCSKCGDCDYGDNEEATDVRHHCATIGCGSELVA